jgi:DNA (cytosine-5)-methyltransferase 1
LSNSMLKVLDLFSGIGGFSLGLERTGGFETVAFCEIEPFPRKVLAKHWPKVPIYDDVRTLTAERLAADGIGVDVICGGFPCQDISLAGKGAGIEGERSGLWSEYARLVGELRPAYVIVENVAALLGRGLDRVLADLATLRYDAEWHCIPASAVGAPHRRDRLWIVARPQRQPVDQQPSTAMQRRRPAEAEQIGLGGGDVADTARVLLDRSGNTRPQGWVELADSGSHVADADNPRLEGWAQAGNSGSIGARIEQLIERRADGSRSAWEPEPAVGRVAHGVPNRVDRLKALGNAVVPQIPELIGHAILAAERERLAA